MIMRFTRRLTWVRRLEWILKERDIMDGKFGDIISGVAIFSAIRPELEGLVEILKSR